jgi:hypothetical protein
MSSEALQFEESEAGLASKTVLLLEFAALFMPVAKVD